MLIDKRASNNAVCQHVNLVACDRNQVKKAPILSQLIDHLNLCQLEMRANNCFFFF